MKNCRHSKRFTLIELLVAMTVLVILALLLFNILGRAQEAWRAMETNTRIYENARVALDLVSRDLQSAVASNENDKEIPFYFGTNSPSGTGNDINRVMLALVSATTRMDNAHSKLTEVAYTFDENRLKRRVVQDHNGNNWDFYGDDTSDWVATSGGGGFHRVINGVEDLTFICYRPDGTVMGDTTGNGMPNEAETTTTLPVAIWFSITLFDPRATDLEGEAQLRMIERSRRTFNKMVYLKTQGF